MYSIRTHHAFILKFAILLFAACNLHAQPIIQVSNQTYLSGPAVTVSAPQAVTASNTVTVNSGANVTYSAGNYITLGPGFSVQSGGIFNAKITTSNAGFLIQSVPNRMTPGQIVPVSITMRNLGTTFWTSAANYKLGSQAAQDNTLWTGTSRVLLGATTINTGQDKTFSFNITAPATPGTYAFQWRMTLDGVEWFGDYTPLVNIRVENFVSTNDNDGLPDSYTVDSSGGSVPDSVKTALGLSVTTPGASVPGASQGFNYDALHRINSGPGRSYYPDPEGGILH